MVGIALAAVVLAAPGHAERTLGQAPEGEATPVPIPVEVDSATPMPDEDSAPELLPDEAAAGSETTAVEPVVNLDVDGSGLTFGAVDASGTLDPTAANITSQADDFGAYYIKTGAFRVTVTANVPWTGICQAEEHVASTVRLAAGRLEWRLAGADEWTPFRGVDDGPPDVCFSSPVPGEAVYVFDVRLRVEQTDPPGAFQTQIVFSAAP